MAKHPEKEAEFKSALRRAILGKSNLMKKELRRGTRFVYSEQYPTQVLNTKLGRFIRINCDDIDEYTVDNLLKIMMGTDRYVTLPERTIKDETGAEVILPEETMDYVEVLENSIDTVRENDYVNLMPSKPTGSADDDDDWDDDEDIIVETDEYSNVTGLKNVTIQPQVIHYAGKIEDLDAEFDPSKFTVEDGSEEIESDTSSSDMTEMCETLAAAGADDGTGTPPDKGRKEVVQLVEQALNDIEQFNGISRFHSNSSILTKKDLIALEPKVKQLLKAFQGVGGTVKLVTPTKRMSSKDIACDRDKCYIRKTGSTGKHIKMNLLIDMSGSMSGSPVKNAVRLVYLFNQLAKEGYVTMSVLYSTTSTNFKLTLPASDSEILALCATQSAEGLAKTIHAHADTIRGTNTICITDGDIVDEPIDKMFWAKHKSISTGVYVNKSITNYAEHSGKLNKWFNHSIVRKSLDELIEWLIRVGLKG